MYFKRVEKSHQILINRYLNANAKRFYASYKNCPLNVKEKCNRDNRRRSTHNRSERRVALLALPTCWPQIPADAVAEGCMWRGYGVGNGREGDRGMSAVLTAET